jgi:uncharacterized protein
MLIDLNKIRDILVINQEYNFSEDYFKNTDIKKLPKVSFNGKIYYDFENNLKLEGLCEGVMILPDSITLDDIEYPFSFEIDYLIDKNNEEIAEYYENIKNTLDIMGILWQNIVLEVPMRITKSNIEDIKSSGDGWDIINDKKKDIDPRLAKLTELLDDSGKEKNYGSSI